MFLYNENDISFDENGIFYGFKKDPFREEKDKFVKAVNQFLKFHAGTRIVSFVVSFHLGNDYKNDVDEWIRSAIGMGAERLTLCLSVHDGEQIDKYVFCCELLSQGPFIKFSFIGVPKLQTVYFTVNQKRDMQYIFSQLAKDIPNLRTVTVNSTIDLCIPKSMTSLNLWSNGILPPEDDISSEAFPDMEEFLESFWKKSQ
ncbi:hypothetical protein SO802_015512 [Lithocarpus litseifolius]|uniref:Uncharacterized protein n=1 Tax=Lithocarpus litseifolius TaxID=425828 RepID=A0AAW2CZ72_9ROSI